MNVTVLRILHRPPPLILPVACGPFQGSRDFSVIAYLRLTSQCLGNADPLGLLPSVASESVPKRPAGHAQFPPHAYQSSMQTVANRTVTEAKQFNGSINPLDPVKHPLFSVSPA